MSERALSRRELFGFWRGGRRAATPSPRPLLCARVAAPAVAAPAVETSGAAASLPAARARARAFGRGQALPLHRPPGAAPEAAFLAGCTRCMDCARACPHQAIVAAPPRAQAAAGTPVIDAAVAPCLSCADMPCATACAPGVLSPARSRRMGTARVLPHACLAHLGVGCSVCVERCPVPGALRLERGRPTIDPDACTGCGVCIYVCPAPQKAILLLPLPHRPAEEEAA